jgi:hypothetical protein
MINFLELYETIGKLATDYKNYDFLIFPNKGNYILKVIIRYEIHNDHDLNKVINDIKNKRVANFGNSDV